MVLLLLYSILLKEQKQKHSKAITFYYYVAIGYTSPHSGLFPTQDSLLATNTIHVTVEVLDKTPNHSHKFGCLKNIQQ